MVVAVGISPVVEKTTVSCVNEALPAAPRIAPPVPSELSQPGPGNAFGLLQGQGMMPAMPGLQKATIGPPAEPSGTSALTASTVAVLNVVSEICTVSGGWSASKRKLYSVPQRNALALGSTAKGVVAQLSTPALTEPAQSVPSKLTLPGPSPSW